MSKKEATIIIQKNFRTFKAKKEVEYMKKQAGNQEGAQVIHMQLVNGDEKVTSVIVSCKKRGDKPIALIFFFKQSRKTTGRVDVDLVHMGHISTQYLKTKVQ